MELGDEVSIKIKSAIRARLKELGIVWDRELPDYVMVLIANKKSKEQMEKDLTIFLGSHTTGFTAWLHNVLKKLEECTTYRGLTKKKEEEKKSKSKRRPSEEDHQESKKLKGNDVECDDDGNLNATSDSGSENAVPNHHSPVRIDEGLDSDVFDFSVATLELSDAKLSSSVNDSIGNNSLNSDLNNTEKNMTESFVAESRLEKEEETDRVIEKPKPKEKIEISWSSEKVMDYSADTKHFSPVKRIGLRGRGERNQSRSKSRSRTGSQHHFDQGDHVPVLKRAIMKENLRKGEERRPYRASRGAFRRKNSEERRNGYDKNSRMIGKVRNEKDINLRKRCGSRDTEVDKLPSLVKVTPRPVRPPTMQPSSNLILKAVAEAQKSIATSSLPQPDDKVVKKKEKNRMSRKAVYRKKNIPAFQRENISVTLLNDRVIADKIREEDGDTLMFENNIRKHENQFNDGPEVERFTISLVSDDNDSLIASDIEDASEEKILTEEQYSEAEQNVATLDEPMDISSTTAVEENMEEADSREFPGQRFDRRRLGPRVIPDADTVLSFDQIGRKHCGGLNKSLPNQVTTCRYCSHVVPRGGLAPTDDSITKTIMNENVYAAGDGKTDENGKVIKCKFWPTCEAGNDCRFYHPKEYCRTLPNCKFGQKCLYYHPPCKFADKCLNVTCPYTHTAVPAPTVKAKVWTKVPLAPSNGQICMYYPNCKKPFCPYQHSYSATTGIPCKFGINCAKGTCEFDHTHLPKNPYKWVNHNTE